MAIATCALALGCCQHCAGAGCKREAWQVCHSPPSAGLGAAACTDNPDSTTDSRTAKGCPPHRLNKMLCVTDINQKEKGHQGTSDQEQDIRKTPPEGLPEAPGRHGDLVARLLEQGSVPKLPGHPVGDEGSHQDAAPAQGCMHRPAPSQGSEIMRVPLV